MAMLRRLHVLGTKDPASQLLRTLSSRTTPCRDAESSASSSPENIYHSQIGAIGPPSLRRSSPSRGSDSLRSNGNTGLCGLADTGRSGSVGGGWQAPEIVGATRYLTSAEPRAER